MEGLEDINIQPYIGIANMRKTVESQSHKSQTGDSEQQYLCSLSPYDLVKIDRARHSIGKHTRMTHYTDIDLLMVKLPSAKHEAAHLTLVKVMDWKFWGWECGKKFLPYWWDSVLWPELF